MSYVVLASISLASLSFILSLVACRMASKRFLTGNLTRQLRNLSSEVTDLSDQFAKLEKLTRRQTARANMEKARAAKKNSQDEMTEDEWRKWATKQIQLGNPIE